jgi:hypothetical protein
VTATTNVNIPVQSLMKRMTLNVRITGHRQWWIRQWIGIHLLIGAAWVMGCGIQIEPVQRYR